MFPGGINFVEITPEDHIFIEDIYNQIIKKYVKIIKSGNGNSDPLTEKVPTFQDAVKFLIEHANFNENDMENFVIRLKGINNKE
ncbi:MAG: hypothetical protein MPEBLZ_01634 [Candidatus Methanoperedens nitroreducens]|uniref:Uncharacterized protein n=1 Tax=Candidatus Methanoperedens nitratireducens TaxID=1392998 RepID=A0A0P7ZG21_9EURY|nr:MAG: hypothetical protein MPEBLZ_01634 [Candidatus Methanoperedens sp. BLZ1]